MQREKCKVIGLSQFSAPEKLKSHFQAQTFVQSNHTKQYRMNQLTGNISSDYNTFC